MRSLSRFGRTVRGFTLLEMTIVIAISGIFAALAVVNLRSTLSAKREYGAARQVSQLVKRARTLALNGHSLVRVEADAATGLVSLSRCPCKFGALVCANNGPFTAIEGASIQLDKDDLAGVKLTAVPASQLEFGPGGSPVVAAVFEYNIDHAEQNGLRKVRVNASGDVSVQ